MATTPFSTLFGHTASSAPFKSYLDEVGHTAGIEIPEPDVKAYGDAVYFNYYRIGLSFMFIPAGISKTTSMTSLDPDALLLDSVDVFNTVKAAAPSKGKTHSQFPLLPLSLSVPVTGSASFSTFELRAGTTGKELVQALGEPSRKGGGAGPSSGSIGIWCEWSKFGIMVEFGGDEARGPQAWERGKDAVWKVVTLFKPKVA